MTIAISASLRLAEQRLMHNSTYLSMHSAHPVDLLDIDCEIDDSGKIVDNGGAGGPSTCELICCWCVPPGLRESMGISF